MSDYTEHLKSSLHDPEFKEEWNAQAPEREVMRLIVEARMAEGMTQAELALACGMKPANLCRLENGNGNPSVATLYKIARGLGRKLEIRFV
ncbi:MAG: helix-turn-helix transcriptional regulator [Eggerthellaceae bacterium]|nr:helix-turn-helix transcriptional regulator [Eggerthellaceae bacterium]MDO5118135.1 helix-turn-helix transcriptional regulator [Eggerthellaceae bacterium]